MSHAQKEETLKAFPHPECSMADIRKAAEQVGVELVGVEATWAELEEVRGPKIIHLKDPAHFLVVSRTSPEWVQVLDCAGVDVLRKDGVRDRYTGRSLILKHDQEAAGPRLSLGEFHHEFRVTCVGQEVQHAFEVTNAGDEDLALAPQASGCAAPPVTIRKELLGPGESTHVTLTLKAEHWGTIMGSGKLLTNDLDRPVAFLTIRGTVPDDLRIHPDRIHLVADKGHSVRRSVQVVGPSDLNLRNASCGRDLFSAVIEDQRLTEDERKTWIVRLTFDPGEFIGQVDDQLSIHTTRAEWPLIAIPISAVVRGDLEATPKSAFFGFVRLRAQVHQEVVIRSRSGTPFAVKGAQTDDERIRVGKPRQEAEAWTIALSMDTARPGIVDGTITIASNVPGEESLKVNVYAHVLRTN